MKRKIWTLALSSILCMQLGVLASCGDQGVTIKNGETYFTRAPYVDLSHLPEKISFKYAVEGDIDYITIGTRTRLAKSDYGYNKKEGILTISTANFKDEKGKYLFSSGDQQVKIKADSLLQTSILFVDKVIKTAEDLQKINENPSGSYILGNDIDCSSISNFEPLGYIESDSRYQQEFLGVFEGNGYAIKNVTTRYATDVTSSEAQYKGNYLFEDESHREGNQFGVFQIIGTNGVVRNTMFSNCKIFGKTITGVIAGQNEGRIENCFIDDKCEAHMSTHYYDDWCNAGTICGINGEVATVQNVISLGKSSIEPMFIDYNDNYLEATEEGQEPINHHTFYGNEKTIFTDSNDDNGCGVYAGIGMNIGLAKDCYAQEFNINTTGKKAYFGQTHLYANMPSDGDDKGLFQNCEVKTAAELKNVALYETFSKDVWNIYDGTVPTFKAIYPTATFGG